MRKEMREVFIANDGNPFLSIEDVAIHEQNLAKEELKRDFMDLLSDLNTYDLTFEEIVDCILDQMDEVNEMFSKYNEAELAIISEKSSCESTALFKEESGAHEEK